MLKKHITSTVMLLLSLALSATSLAADLKPRIIVLTDIAPNNVEPDDMESMIRLLAHADLFEIEGLVSTTGWSDGGGQEHPDLIQAAINAYEKDLPNLRKRSNQDGHLADESQQKIGYWPSAEYLRTRTMLGSKKRGFSFIGKDNNSPGLGPQGLGGDTTALSVLVETAPCHIASLPVAVNIECHSHRHKTAVI